MTRKSMNPPLLAKKATPVDQVPAEQPKPVAKLLDALPGLCGAIDAAIKDQTGINQPFVLVVFHGSNAVHVTNFEPAEAMRMLKAMVAEG